VCGAPLVGVLLMRCLTALWFRRHCRDAVTVGDACPLICLEVLRDRSKGRFVHDARPVRRQRENEIPHPGPGIVRSSCRDVVEADLGLVGRPAVGDYIGGNPAQTAFIGCWGTEQPDPSATR